VPFNPAIPANEINPSGISTMPFAVHLFFDADTEAVIKSAWRKLADTRIAPYMHQSANRPHFSLAIYEGLDLPDCEQRLKSFAATRNSLPVAFQYLGVFPTTPATVFLSSTVTIALLELHAQIHEILQPISAHPNPYYLPGNWVPHCTLALELEPRLIAEALEVGLQVPLPWHSEITEIGVIEFRPVKHLFGFWLGEAHTGSTAIK
jgi:2'-5' RNA ligase